MDPIHSGCRDVAGESPVTPLERSLVPRKSGQLDVYVPEGNSEKKVGHLSSLFS